MNPHNLPGDPLELRAEDLNWMLRAGQAQKDAKISRPPTVFPQTSTGHIIVKNQSGVARSRFDVLGIDTPIFTPTQNLSEFTSRPAVRGVVPQDIHAGRFVVLADALKPNGIGRAVVSGLCVAKVRMEAPVDTSADVLAGDATRLVSGSSGVATILWHNPPAEYPDTAWAILRIGGGGGGGGNPFGYCVVRSYTDLSPWTLQIQKVVPVDRALGTWDVVGDIFTGYTHVIRSRYYQPFVWNGNVTSIHEGHILPTFNEGGNIVVLQHTKMALVAQPTIRPITDCQVF